MRIEILQAGKVCLIWAATLSMVFAQYCALVLSGSAGAGARAEIFYLDLVPLSAEAVYPPTTPPRECLALVPGSHPWYDGVEAPSPELSAAIDAVRRKLRGELPPEECDDRWVLALLAGGAGDDPRGYREQLVDFLGARAKTSADQVFLHVPAREGASEINSTPTGKGAAR